MSDPASRPRDARSICVAERRRLGGQFEDQVDRRLRRAPQVGKPGFLRHLAQALFARLHTAGLELRLTDRMALLADFDCDFARRRGPTQVSKNASRDKLYCVSTD
jgi:hypothetical protein